ncbi:MAG: translocation/assembly module TamB domain-containing protein [Flavisolibacter sp.]
MPIFKGLIDTPMEEEQKRINYPRKLGRIFLKVLLFVFLFIVLVFLLVLTPPVQHFLTGKVQNYLQTKLKTRVAIGGISFGLSGKLNLDNVYIEDRTKDTLISGGSVKAHINFVKLFSNEVEIKDIELQNITAKIKRVLPDTIFNYQFIVDAFASEKKKKSDTAQSAPMKLNISDVALDNVSLSFADAITGNDVFAHIGNLSATIDTLDPYTYHFDIPTIIARNVQARIRQSKPLVKPEPLSSDMAAAAQPSPMRLQLGTIELSRISVQLDNEASAFYTTLNLGQLKGNSKLIDLPHNRIYLDQVSLSNTKSVIRLGKKETAKEIARQASQEIKAQKAQGWDFRIAGLQVANNTLQFDNDNQPRLSYGMDYAHFAASELSLKARDFVMNPDSVAATISQGSMKEKSGFVLEELKGNLFYGNTQSYLKDLYIKTPGTEIQKSLVLDYPSLEALTRKPAETVFNIALVHSHIQVRDILVFAPQLRNNPALAHPNEIWNINMVGSGTLNRLNIESLQFAGLRNTQIDAAGTLTGLMNPKDAGGNFIIHRLHTTQTDIALFTGQRLSNAQMNLPEAFDITGTVRGNAGQLNTKLNVSTSAGFMALDGNFANLTSPTAISYNATVTTNNLALGSLLRQPDQYGPVSGHFSFKGSGLTPASIHADFKGVLSRLGYNHYQYHDIALNGSLKKTAFTVAARVQDPNIDLNLKASGNYSGKPSFRIEGMIDSIKTLPLHFTTQPVIFRGQINGTVNNLSPDDLEASVLITKGLLVSGTERLPLDTLQFLSGKNDTASFMRLKSNIINIQLTGQYRLTDLANIIQNSVGPYFQVQPVAKTVPVKPYHFNFTADAVYNPILTTFLPSLTAMGPLHAEGSFVSGQGMQAFMTTPQLSFAGNDLSDLNVRANTSDSGLLVSAKVAHLKSGNSFDVYNTRINASANHNIIDFNLGTDDIRSRNKYYFSGTIQQPAAGTYAIRLKPDSLLLNYEKWTVAPDNLITIGTNNISAHDFLLQKGTQQLSINSLAGGQSQPLQIKFTAFRLATITGFIKSDSLLVDGVMNGDVTFQNIMKQPVFTSNLTINDLSMKQDTLGNVNIRVDNTSGDRYHANILLTGQGNDVAITGDMIPQGNEVLLDMNLAVRQLELKSMQGAMAGAITNASGMVNGDVKILGSLTNPSIKGDLNFHKASFALTMLGSQFTIDNEKLSVNEDGFVFQGFTIRDSANNALNLNGTVSTQNLINYRFNLYVNADHFLLLNSVKKQNSIYYGRLNISSDLYLSGTETKPVLDGALTVNDGTNLTIVIPQVEPGVIDREGIVQFVDMKAPENDSLFRRYDSLNVSRILGMDITANLEIKKEAIFNIIVDEANGDFLNVRGEALLSTGVDPSGKITLVGNYQLEEGAYQLSFNFLQRRFDIEKGSTITWTGSPTDGELNVKAVYVANTAPIDLVQDQIAAAPSAIRNTYLQKLPFEVHLNLTGELMQPKVGFDIVLPEDKNYGVSNDIVTQVQSRLTQIRTDQGEINKQVFSLLLLGRFVGQDPFQSSGGGFNVGTYARESVSKLMTEQLNNLAGSLIQGVDLNFDVASTDDYTTGERRNRTDLNIGLTKKLLNDRLQVTVGNNFELEGPQNSGQKNNNIAGNVAVNYQLTKDGRYMIRFYRKNEYVGVVDGYIIETGLGFILNVDYNRFAEILHRKKQKVTMQDSTKNGQRP